MTAGHTSQTAFARLVCREFGFLDSRREPRRANCQKAMRGLHRQGRIGSPPPLQPDWHRVLGADAPTPGPTLGPADGLALDTFAANKLG